MSGTRGSLLYIFFLFISKSGTKWNPFFSNSQQDRGIIILICSRYLTKGPRGQATHPRWLEHASSSLTPCIPPMPGPIYTCLILPLGDQFKYQTLAFTLWFLAGLSQRVFWCCKSIMMFLKERVPQSHVSQKGSVMSPNDFYESKGCWFVQSANNYMPLFKLLR